MKLKIKNYCLIIISFALIIGFAGDFQNGVAAVSVSEMQDKYKELEEKNKKLEIELKNVKEELNDEEAYQNTLTEKINVINEQLNIKEKEKNTLEYEIAVKNKEIETKENEIEIKLSEIDEKETQIDGKQAEIDITLETFKKRLRAMYIAGESSNLNMLFNAENMGDFMSNIIYLRRISDHDNALIEHLKLEKNEFENLKMQLEAIVAELENKRTELEEQRNKLEGQRAELDDSKKELQNKQIEISDLYRKTAASIKEMENLEQKILNNRDQIDKEMERLEAEITGAINEAKSQNHTNYTSKGFTWPLPGYARISSYFGEGRGSSIHKGIDIPAPEGTNIIASNSGTVIKVINTYSRGVGYGKYLMIDHGGGNVTLYAHCIKILVSEGQSVKKGDVIAEVGSTGNSTGNHLHFEFRIDGAVINPLSKVQYGE